MVGKCAGLPLAIIVLGGLLATKDTLSEWKRVHKYINSYLIRGELHEKQSRLAKVLALSYHDLPYQLKPCFLYLSQFPEDSEIPANKLIKLWVAEGIVPSRYEFQRDETLEDVAEHYLGNLVSRCMIEIGQMGSTGRIKTCRLHDIMRELCLSKATQVSFVHIASDSQQNMTSSSNQTGAESAVAIRRLAVFLYENVEKVIPFKQQGNQLLRSLLYFHGMENWQTIKGVFERFKLLRVLDLEGVKELKQHSLPKEVGNLLWLKFLSLKRTRIRILPFSLGNLENLQTLNLETVNKVSFNSTVQIPNVLWKLKRLRHLYLPNWCGNITDKLQLENLVNLQTLINFPANKCDVKDLLQLSKLRKLVLNDPRYFQKFAEIFTPPNEKLEYLQSLSLRTDMLSIPEDMVDIEKLVLGCPSLQKLHIEGRVERLPGNHLFPPQLGKLTMWGCRLVEDPMPTLEMLPNLKYLSGWEMYLGKKMVCSQNGFPQLKLLLLRGFPNLEEWIVENQAMPNLFRLGISDCKKLNTVPEGLKFAGNLRELEIRWMSKCFNERIANGGEDHYKVEHVPYIVFLN
ncbi:hypothetical protein L6164_006661 [Bauhinia variegata]|nr:hypothetical protein L6164_006661 [Bauhinia variegata]